MLRGNYHIGGTEQSIAPGGVDLEFLVHVLKLEEYGRTLASAYPVPLHSLYCLGPVQKVKVLQKPVGICCNLEHPLAYVLAHYSSTAALALALFDLFVGKTGLAGRTEVYRLLRLVSKSFFVQFKENPLSPLIVVRLAGRDFPVPVVAESQRFYLAAEYIDILMGGNTWMCSCLNSVVFGRQAEGVESHWVQHRIAVHTQVAAVDVGGGIAFRVAYMQTCSGRIWEHIQDIFTFFCRDRRILNCLEGLVLIPVLLPFFFYFCKRIFTHIQYYNFF